jgi:hypothetical protein
MENNMNRIVVSVVCAVLLLAQIATATVVTGKSLT